MPPKLDEQGNPVVGEDGQPVMIDDTIAITQEQYDTMLRNEGRVAALDEHGTQFTTPVTPVAPTGPTPEEQLTTQLTGINGEIATIGKQIDEAVASAKPVSELMTQRDNLMERKMNLQTDFKVADIASQGLDTISQLTSRIVADKMPYLSIPEVKKGYDTTLASMSAAQKASPDAHKIAYDLSCGQNVDKIHEVMVEEANRNQEGDVNVQGGGAGGGGDAGTARNPATPTGGEGGNPTFLDHFGQDTIDTITAQGKTPDEWARRMGYESAQAYVDFAIEQEREEGAIQ